MGIETDPNIAIAQAMGLRRVAADRDRGWDDFMQGRTPDNEEFAGEEFAGCMLAAPILRALAAELALKAIASKMTGTHERGHDLLNLFDRLDQSVRDCIEQQDAAVRHVRTHGSIRSILANHKDDFTGWRYLGESWQGKNPYGDDLDAALIALRSGPRNLDSGLSEISIVFQAAVPKPVALKYTTSGVRRPSEL